MKSHSVEFQSNASDAIRLKNTLSGKMFVINCDKSLNLIFRKMVNRVNIRVNICTEIHYKPV